MELQLHGGEAYGEHEIWDQAGDTSRVLSRGPQADSLLGVQQLGGGRDCGSRQGRYIHIESRVAFVTASKYHFEKKTVWIWERRIDTR